MESRSRPSLLKKCSIGIEGPTSIRSNQVNSKEYIRQVCTDEKNYRFNLSSVDPLLQISNHDTRSVRRRILRMELELQSNRKLKGHNGTLFENALEFPIGGNKTTLLFSKRKAPMSLHLTTKDTLAAPSEHNLFDQAIVENCKQLWIKKIKDPEASETELREIDTTQIKKFPPYSLPEYSMKGRSATKEVLALLKQLDQDRLAIVGGFFYESANKTICHELSFQVFCALIKDCPEIRSKLEAYCVQNFFEMVYDGFGIRVLWTLDCSVTFCYKGLQLIESRFDELITNMGAVQVLTALIAKVPEESAFEFILKNLSSKMKDHNNNHMLRVLSTLIERVSPANLKRVEKVLEPHVNWMMDDKLGNFTVQALIKRNCVKIIDGFKQECLETPVKIFIQKFRKYCFIEVMKDRVNKSFVQQVAWGFIYSPKNTHIIFSREDSTKLLLALLSFANFEQTEIERFSRLLMSEALGDVRIMNAGYFQFFMLMLDLLKKGDYSGLLENINIPLIPNQSILSNNCI